MLGRLVRMVTLRLCRRLVGLTFESTSSRGEPSVLLERTILCVVLVWRM